MTEAQNAHSESPFAGLKVLTVATVFAAPFAAYQLGLHGADVVSVEDTSGGDRTRTDGAENARHLISQKMGPAYLAHAANKRSMTLNLRDPRGQAIFRELARDADVLIENMRTGGMAKYGLAWDDLKAINPRLIYCSLTGFGQTGPKARDGAIDVVVQALSGMMSFTGTPESGPLKAGTTVVDYMSGFATALAVVTALYHRTSTGRGQFIDVSMLETALLGMSYIVSNVQNAGFKPKLMGNRTSTNVPVNNSIRCSDVPVMVAAASDNLRRKFLIAIGREDLLTDPRFATHAAMLQHVDELYAEVESVTMTRTAAEWEDLLNKAGVPCARVYQIAEAVDSPQIRHRGLYQEIGGIPGIDAKLKLPLASYRFSEAKASLRTPPARLGEHTAEVLAELGYDQARIDAFRADGVI